MKVSHVPSQVLRSLSDGKPGDIAIVVLIKTGALLESFLAFVYMMLYFNRP